MDERDNTVIAAKKSVMDAIETQINDDWGNGLIVHRYFSSSQGCNREYYLVVVVIRPRGVALPSIESVRDWRNGVGIFPDGMLLIAQDERSNSTLPCIEDHIRAMKGRFNAAIVVPRPEIMDFARIMEAKMRKYDKARGTSWRTTDTSDLLLGFYRHVAKFDLCEDAEQIPLCAADVANFCWMIVDNLGLLKGE